MLGFDAPLGVPRSYLQAIGRAADSSSCGSFVEWLRKAVEVPGFFKEDSDPDAWCVHRPFFRITGEGSRTRWEARLGTLRVSPLRAIDKLTGAKPVFVVSGIPGSVGSAARDVWRGLLRFFEKDYRLIGLWPFDGSLAELAARGRVVVGEIYPRVLYAVALSDAKAGDRRQEPLKKNKKDVRRAALARLRSAAWVKKHGVRLREPDMDAAEKSADAFDALMAAAGLLRCLLEDEPLSAQEDGVAEGGILGSGAVVLGEPSRSGGSRRSAPARRAASRRIRCPIPGCRHEFLNGRGGWDAHVGSLRRHPMWHPKVTDPKERKAIFRSEFPDFFR